VTVLEVPTKIRAGDGDRAALRRRALWIPLCDDPFVLESWGPAIHVGMGQVEFDCLPELQEVAVAVAFVIDHEMRFFRDSHAIAAIIKAEDFFYGASVANDATLSLGHASERLDRKHFSERGEMKVDLLIVGEEFREDGQDRASIVAGAILFTLSKLLNIVPNAQGRANLTPAEIEAKVRAGCFVVLVDENLGPDKTPKINAAISATNEYCYVLPLCEGEELGDKVVSIEEAAVGFVEYLAERHCAEPK